MELNHKQSVAFAVSEMGMYPDLVLAKATHTLTTMKGEEFHVINMTARVRGVPGEGCCVSDIAFIRKDLGPIDPATKQGALRYRMRTAIVLMATNADLMRSRHEARCRN